MLAAAAVLTATGAFLYLRLADDLSSSVNQGLRARAQDLAATVRGSGDSSLAGSGAAGLVEHGESYAQLIGADGRVLDATSPLRGRPTLTPAELERAGRATILLDRGPLPGLDEPSRLLATPLGPRRPGVVLVVGTTLGDRAEALDNLRTELLIGGPIALLLVSLAGYVLAGAALRPVESMRARAAEISAERPGARLPVTPAHDEVRRLGETLNEMLGRLEDALAHERRLVADAGHELRTPLSLMKTEIELALRHGGTVEDLERSLRSAADETDRLAQLAEDLLFLAQADHGELPASDASASLSAVCATVVRRFAGRPELGGGEIETDLPDGLLVHADPLQLDQAVGNMVDNALRHGAAPVSLSARVADDNVEVHVRDRGPGLPAAFIPHAFERFSRADEARTGGGAGLGLAIVRAVAQTSGGTAHIANRPEGGADVWLSLPRAQGDGRVPPERP